jgi:hypothetical protein
VKVQDLRYAFPKATPFAFLFENAHLLLLTWERDNAKFLFLIQHEDDGTLHLDYPGELFTSRVMDAIESIFFIQVQEEGTEPKRYALGSYFKVGSRTYCAYYQRDVERPDVVLFRVEGEAPQHTLEVLDPKEYQAVAEAFQEQHQDMMEIQVK